MPPCRPARVRCAASRTVPLLALLAGAVFAAGPTCAARGTTAPAPVAFHVSADPEIAALLTRVEDQVAQGHTTAPTDDNAMESWSKVVQRTSPPSAAAAEALTDFIADAHHRASEAKQAGRDAVALDLVVFADLARDLLKEAPIAPGSAPPAAAPPAPQPPRAAEPAMQPPVAMSPIPQPPAAAGPPPRPQELTQPIPQPQELTQSIPQPQEVTRPTPQPRDVTARQTLVAAAAVPRIPVVTPPPVSRPAAARPIVMAPPALPPEVAKLYISRGDALLAQKDISGARKFYEFAANAGSARGAAALAATYDPNELQRLGVVGLPPNPAQAIAWYQRAITLGDANARPPLLALQTQSRR